jgi:hypothetical protein
MCQPDASHQPAVTARETAPRQLWHFETDLNAMCALRTLLQSRDWPVVGGCVACRYGSVKKMLRAACDSSGAQLVTAEVSFPIRWAGATVHCACCWRFALLEIC